MQVGLAVDKVDADKRLAALALIAVETLATGVCSYDDALRAVEALMVVTGAGARKHHRGRKLTEQPAGTHKVTQTQRNFPINSLCVE